MKKCLICDGYKFHTLSGLFDDRYGSSGEYSVDFCDKCGFGRTTPSLSDQELGRFYAKYYPLKKITANDTLASIDKSSDKKKWLMGTNNVAHQYVGNYGRVLDIGSASGVSLIEISKKGLEAYGVEPDPSSTQIANRLKLKVFNGLITDNPFPKIKFDYITGSQVIEHSTDPIIFLKSINKKLNKSGEIILSFPNSQSLYRYLFNRMWINWHVPYHINHFSKKSIEILAKKTNHKILKIKTVTPNLWTGIQFAKLFSKSNFGRTDLLWKSFDQVPENDKATKIFLNIIQSIVTILITPFNRLIDLFGYGDSYVIILSKK